MSLDEASPDKLLQQLLDANINTMWIQEEPDLVGWIDRHGAVEELLIGDCEYEVRVINVPSPFVPIIFLQISQISYSQNFK